MNDAAQQGAPPLWATALDKMRDHDGNERDEDVVLSSAEAIAFVRHYLRTAEAGTALADAGATLVRLNLAPDVESLAWIPSQPTPLELAEEHDGALARIRDALTAWEEC